MIIIIARVLDVNKFLIRRVRIHRTRVRVGGYRIANLVAKAMIQGNFGGV